jgi:hypothetical protein
MYNVQVEYIAKQIDEEVKAKILDFLENWDFPYVQPISNKTALKTIFKKHFEERHTLKWLQNEIVALAKQEDVDSDQVRTVALSETNRLHTMGLGSVLLSKGIRKCTTENSYGTRPMSEACWRNLEGKPKVVNNITVKSKPKILDIQEIINNSFPEKSSELERTDIPMIPQNSSCYHIMVPVN